MRRGIRFGAAVAAVLVLLPTAGTTASAEPPATFSATASGDILNHSALLGEVGGRSWFENNVPFIELPDNDIQRVYYYRYDVLRRALKSTVPGTGYVANEFQTPVFWSAPFGGISLNPWHNNRDGRWLRNRQYLDDDTNYWTTGLGYAENLNYTGPMADSVWQRYLVTGDQQFVLSQLPGLVAAYRKTEAAQFTPSLGLFWSIPHNDGTEFTIGSFQTNDSFKGGVGYRPTLNGYMYGDANAISRLARMGGDNALADEFANKASALKAAVQSKLWDSSRGFFYERMKDNAAQEYGQHPDGGARNTSLPILPEGTLLDGRELTGYIPWMFGLPDDSASFAGAWSQLLDTQGFNTTAGPPVAERRHRLFNFKVYDGCCRWTGPQWPMGTSQTLVGMDNLLHNYTNNTAVTRADYFTLLKKYTTAQFKNGRPYVAEAADSLAYRWIYDGGDHSENYNHSGYADHVLGGLFGLRPQTGGTIVVDPMVPSGWDYFAAENVPYHGHLLKLVWDRTGSRYGLGVGLRVFVDGNQAASSAGLGKLTVNVGATSVPAYSPEINLAANPFNDQLDRPTNPYPAATASYTSGADNPSRAIDGSVWYDKPGLGTNSRWTTYGSPNGSDWLQVDFGRATDLNQVRLSFYDDTGTGSIRVPRSYQVQYWNGSAWAGVAEQSRVPSAPQPNDSSTVSFARVSTTKIRVLVTPQSGQAVGISEVEAFNRGVVQTLPANAVQIVNKSTGRCLAVAGASTADGAGIVQQTCDSGSAAQKFTITPTDSGYNKVVSQLSGRVLDVYGVNVGQAAQVVQWSYLGGGNQQWKAIPTGYGTWSLVARHSSRALDVPGCQAGAGVQLQQYDNLGNDCQKFSFR